MLSTTAEKLKKKLKVTEKLKVTSHNSAYVVLCDVTFDLSVSYLASLTA